MERENDNASEALDLLAGWMMGLQIQQIRIAVYMLQRGYIDGEGMSHSELATLGERFCRSSKTVDDWLRGMRQLGLVRQDAIGEEAQYTLVRDWTPATKPRSLRRGPRAGVR